MNNTVTYGNFQIGDKVNTPYGVGFVWKVTESSVHVKHNSSSKKGDWLYSKYLANPKHHSQKPISAISHCI